MRGRYLSIFAILLLILAAVISPILYSGYHDLHSAQTALVEKKYDDAARLDEFWAAIYRLVWWGYLGEGAGCVRYLGMEQGRIDLPLEIACK